ncbi:DUF6624 domain-containing protein [Dyella silvatica]|uniref:DUF6624 domain-containing protein n=1 Tax=Dyella silvatica TaxID=2992128 RepID=UPI0022502735|nr:DUF6624 domain-containing protein [Dyella silvatica]
MTTYFFMRLFFVMVVLGVSSTTLATDADYSPEDLKVLAIKCPNARAWLALHGNQQGVQLIQTATSQPTDPALRAQLIEMSKADADVRNAWINAGSPYPSKQADAMMALDAKNLPFLQQMVARYGFPTVSQVGRDGMDAAWLLVQHADRAPALQIKVAKLIQARRGADSPRSNHVAMLRDRILDNAGRKQLYGTQLTMQNGKWQPNPSEGTPEEIDKRRAEAAMLPLAENVCVINALVPPGNN